MEQTKRATAVLLGVLLLVVLGVATAAADDSPRTYVTLPADFPPYTVPVSAPNDGSYLFLASFNYAQFLESNAYLLIIDNSGEPVYYQPMAPLLAILDFKRQPNGQLTFFVPRDDAFYVMDNTYTIVGRYTAGNGRTADLHDLQLLPNGNALLMIYDRKKVDMSAVVPGGDPDAVVTGLVIQEVDPAGNVVFEWESWDHMAITDTNQKLTAREIDYVHGNSLELDDDGNILLSSRHLDEVTKISRTTGEILWRLGGKRNEFTFLNDEGFCFQHDARRTAAGTLTVYDNGNCHEPPYSRAVEYEVDEVAKTVRRVWQYRNTPDTFAPAMGNAQRLPNGNTVIGWGLSSTPVVTEVTAAGAKVFELHQTPTEGAYRAFRFPWQGFPRTAPTLAARPDGDTVRLYYSWNGATEVARYRVYGGATAATLSVRETTTKTGFETMSVIDNVTQRPYFFRVAALNAQGAQIGVSNLVIVGGHDVYLPLMQGEAADPTAPAFAVPEALQ